jgi:uncharacterized membrane protein
MDRKYLMTALGYAVLGMLLGIIMAASHNHIQKVTHAHILLVGFVVSFVYAICYRLWLPNAAGKLAMIQFLAHQLGTLGMVTGLFLLYGQFVEFRTIEPVLAISSIVVLSAMVLMKVQIIRAPRHPA